MSTDLETIKRKIAENKEYLLKTYAVEEIDVFVDLVIKSGIKSIIKDRILSQLIIV